MNLFELFVKIGVDDQASDHVSKLSGKLGNGLKTAAGIGVAAVTAASAAVVALTKEAVENYAEYEQLVGGVETLFKDSADTVQDYAANAYKSAGLNANEYMATVTSFSASLVQSLSRSTDEAETLTVEAVEESREKQLQILEESAEQALELLKDSQEKEVDAFEKATDEKIALIDSQYRENLKLIDEEKYNQLKAIDDEIAAINALTDAERAEIKEREHLQKQAELQSRIESAKTIEARQKAEQNLTDYLSDYNQKQVEAERAAQIEQLKAQKDAIKENAKAKEQAAKDTYNADIKAAKATADAELKALKKSQKQQIAELKSANEEKIASVNAYSDAAILSLENVDAASEATSETYKEAAEAANMAIIDMSDNANKTGTDMSLIQNAYQGFAKANYTMLDNLKLGYGGTKTEMERLIADANAVKEANGEMADLSISSFADIVEAIHIIQTEMGITGTTAEEASKTITGSTAAAKAAWSNLLTGIADDNADMETLINNFVDSVGVAAENIIPRIEVALDGTGQLIDTMFPILLDKVPDTISKYLPKLTESAVGMIQTLVDGLKDEENQQKIGKAAKDTIYTLVGGAKDLLPDILDLGVDLVISLATGIGQEAPTMIPEAVNLVMDLVEGLTSPESLLSIGNAALDLVVGLAFGIIDSVPRLLESVPVIIGNLIEGILLFIPEIGEAGIELVIGLMDGTRRNEAQMALMDGVAKMIGAIIRGIIGYGKKMYELGSGIFADIKDGFMDFIDDPIGWGKDLIDNFVGGIRQKWDNLKGTISDVAQSIKDLIGFSEPKEGPLSNFHTYAPDMMDLFAQGVRENEHVVTDQIEKSFDFGKRTIEAAYTVTGDAEYTRHTASTGTIAPSITVNINGADHLDARTLAKEAADAISRELQNLTNRRAAVYG